MPGNAFVYGTLMADEVLHLLIKRVPTAKPATLNGYIRHRVKGQVFPAIVPAAKESKVHGQVLLDLTDKELHVLDVYESEEYFRQTVSPVLEDGSDVKADVYIWKDQYRPMLDFGEWDYQEFRSVHLDKYLEMTVTFMRELGEELN